MLKSDYPEKQIHTIEDLASCLDIPKTTLLKISSNCEKYYKSRSVPKSDGSLRQTYIIKEPLRTIQKMIQECILNKVIFAEYLFFGIAGKKGAIDNGRYHCRHGKPRALITFDIEKFFPSVTPSQINDIWLHFFKFSKPVANLLTKLVTCFNELPQGTCTSNHLSNLIFWNDEPKLVIHLKHLGITYTRLADDIALTFNAAYTKASLNQAIKSVLGFLKAYGFKQNRRKLKIRTEASEMIINKTVCINNAYGSASRKKRGMARKRVFHYIKTYQQNPENPNLPQEYTSIMGLLSHLKSVHPHNDCIMLQHKLMSYKPCVAKHINH